MEQPRRTPRPRNAATLLLVRHDGPAPRVLMGRRSRGHDFMPDKWVFPGGRIHPADYRVPAADALPDATRQGLESGAPATLARALAMTAIRETFEETGLAVGVPSAARVRGTWAPFFAAGFAPSLAGLTYLARAITPPMRHKRFDARFLMADAARLPTLDPVGNGELDELAWFTLPDARGLDLPTVTRTVIDTAEARLSGSAAAPPFWRWTRQMGMATPD